MFVFPTLFGLLIALYGMAMLEITSANQQEIAIFSSLPSNAYLNRLKIRSGRVPELLTFDDHTHMLISRFTDHKELQKNAGFEKMEQNIRVHTAVVRDTTFPVHKSAQTTSETAFYGSEAIGIQLDVPSWGLARIGQRLLPLGTSFGYPVSAGDGVDIYVVDSGVNITHPDFEGRAEWGTTVLSGERDIDDNGHGTFVAGIAGGSKYGVAKKAHIIAVKCLDAKGGGDVSDILRGLHYIKMRMIKYKRPTVINLSIAADKSLSLNKAINALVDSGAIITVAAGNAGNGENVDKDACNFSPASASKAITVGATNQKDTLTNFSNFGKCVDILAPGEDVLSSRYMPNGVNIAKSSGTSFSAPHVAGVVALVLSQNNNASNVKENILSMGTHNVARAIMWHDTPNVMLFSGIESSLLQKTSTTETSHNTYSSGCAGRHASKRAAAKRYLNYWLLPGLIAILHSTIIT